MEWEFVEYLLEAIKINDLNHSESNGGASNKQSQDNGKGNQKMEHWNGPSKSGKGNNNKNSGKLSICFQVSYHYYFISLLLI
jgi:hypothetical protein